MITIVWEINGERGMTSGHPLPVWQKVSHRAAMYKKTFKVVEVRTHD